jgi:hypothetical protein
MATLLWYKPPAGDPLAQCRDRAHELWPAVAEPDGDREVRPGDEALRPESVDGRVPICTGRPPSSTRVPSYGLVRPRAHTRTSTTLPRISAGMGTCSSSHTTSRKVIELASIDVARWTLCTRPPRRLMRHRSGCRARTPATPRRPPHRSTGRGSGGTSPPAAAPRRHDRQQAAFPAEQPHDPGLGPARTVAGHDLHDPPPPWWSTTTPARPSRSRADNTSRRRHAEGRPTTPRMATTWCASS